MADDASNSAFSPAMLVVGGRPAVSYLAVGPGDALHCRRASDSAGTAWPLPQILLSGGAGAPLSMCLAEDRPAVAYQHSATLMARIFVADNETGEGLWQSTTQLWPDYRCETGQFRGLMLLDGVPVIAYEQRDVEQQPHSIKIAVLR